MRRLAVIIISCPIRTRRQLRRTRGGSCRTWRLPLAGFRAEDRSFFTKTIVLQGDKCSHRRGPLAPFGVGGAQSAATRRCEAMNFPAPGPTPVNGECHGTEYDQCTIGLIATMAEDARCIGAGQTLLLSMTNSLRLAAAHSRIQSPSAAPKASGGDFSLISHHNPEACSPNRQSEHGGTRLIPRHRRAAASQASPAKVLKPNGQQDAHRRIAPGRDPGSGAPR
jgi:hypothetical protein